MAGALLNLLSIPLALFIGIIGAVSVFKAVYIDKRTLKCACVGGSNNVPLGFLSLTENLMMIAMAVWMLCGHGLFSTAPFALSDHYVFVMVASLSCPVCLDI